MPGLRESEILKYVNNSFHALKISFANEIGNICQKLNINSIEVMELLTYDKKLNISSAYLKPGFAYGGSCLPKDLLALQTISKINNTNAPLLDSISESNEIQKNRLIDKIVSINVKRIGFMGLAFKQGTDDLRNSPILFVIENLLKKKYTISIFDEAVNMSKLMGGNKAFIEQKYPAISRLIVNKMNDLIISSDIIIINNYNDEMKSLINKLKDKIIIDLVCIGNDAFQINNYYGINW